MKPPSNCTLDYNAASFNHLLLERTSRKWLLVRLRPLVILSDTVQSSPHSSAWHKVALFPSKLRFKVLSLPSFPAPRASPLVSLLSPFFSFRDALLVKFLKTSFGNFVSRWTVLPSAPSHLSSLSVLFHCPGRCDHRRSRHQTSEENHDNPPRSFVKFGALVKPRETVVTCRGVETEGRCYEWPRGGRMIPFRNVPAVPQPWS